MPVTMQQVRLILDSEEPDYGLGAQLGAEALPHLETLVRSGNPMLASKAVYLASLIPEPRSAALDVVDAYALAAKRAERRVAERILGKPRDVVAVHAELREAHRDVRFTAAKGRVQPGRLQQALEAWRAEAQHDLAERDHLRRHGRAPTGDDRASATARMK